VPAASKLTAAAGVVVKAAVVHAERRPLGEPDAGAFRAALLHAAIRR